MILHPGILALLVSSVLVSAMVVYSSVCGVRILLGWDMNSGSERQLRFERQTYLISTILGYFLLFQLVSLFLFLYVADSIAPLIVGAMCAVGTLAANGSGYPALLLKTVNFMFAGVWLILNHADSRGYDYPLLRVKYLLLVVLAPLLAAETVLVFRYFLGISPDVITSCCGSMFGAAGSGAAFEIGSLPPMPTMIAFYAVMTLTVSSGIWYLTKGTFGTLFSFLSALAFVTAVISLISFISCYFYELPTHHCPFCILQAEYGYIGYLLYLLLLCGAVTGIGAGLLSPFRRVPSLADALPAMRRKLVLTAVACYLVFTAIVSYRMIFTSFRLES